jgi:diguanylate cyclase (GGDEF)-like protein
MHETQIDPMTGILDRSSCLKRAAEIVGQIGDGSDSLSVLWIDLDRFKQINGSFGYDGGDRIIAAIAKRLVDAVDGKAEIGRVGADEYVCLAPNMDSDSAEQLAVELLNAIKPPLKMGDFNVRVSASIGIALREHEESADELLERAEWAKSAAKKMGGNRHVLSGNEQVPSHMGIIQAREDLEVEYLLHTALDKGGLQLYYQPILGFNGNVISIEALMRCTVNGKSIAPARFFPVAEKSELIARLGEWSLLQGALQAKKLFDAGMKTKVSINVSRAQLADKRFAQDLRGAILNADVDPALIELELSDSLFADTDDVIQSNLRAARELGISLAIDNFGTGASCMSNLKGLPTRKLKLGRSFISTAHEDSRSLSVVKAMVQLGKELGMSVIAEGVETREQMEALRTLSMDGIQGYYYAKPMDTEALSVWLKDREHA